MAPASKRLREEPVYAPVQRKGCHDGFVYIMYQREFLARGDELYKVGMSDWRRKRAGCSTATPVAASLSLVRQ